MRNAKLCTILNASQKPYLQSDLNTLPHFIKVGLSSSISTGELSTAGSGVTDKHPLLIPIQNPVNRFWADFASSLIPDSPVRNLQQELTIQACEMEEIPGYSIKKILGRGYESIVYEAVQADSERSVAVKKLTNLRVCEGSTPREVVVARTLDHPHCMPVFDAFAIPSGYIVVLPLSSFGSLEITSVPEITVRGAATLLHNIGSAFFQMHSQQIVHRDVKPTNILLLENNPYVLCDFSISSQLSAEDELISGIAGTPVFMAPEISVNKYEPKPCDLWPLGVTVYGLLYGEYPWTLGRVLEQPNETLSGQNVAKNEVNGDVEFPRSPVVPERMKRSLRDCSRKSRRGG
jgi:serine/threonine protein kinase